MDMQHVDAFNSVTIPFTTDVDGEMTTAEDVVAVVRERGSSVDLLVTPSIAIDVGNTGIHYASVSAFDMYVLDSNVVGKIFDVILTEGTVGGNSLAGKFIGSFYIKTLSEYYGKIVFDRYWHSLYSDSGFILGSSTGTLDLSASSVDDYYNGRAILTFSGQSAVITDYVGSTRQPTYDRPFPGGFTDNEPYVILPLGVPLVSSGSHVKADVVTINGSATAAQRLAEMWSKVEKYTVTTASVDPTATAFAITGSFTSQYEWLNQAIFWLSGTNAGETSFITSAAEVEGSIVLGVSTLRAAPGNNDTFVKLGRKV